jgi:hypothetical protein
MRGDRSQHAGSRAGRLLNDGGQQAGSRAAAKVWSSSRSTSWCATRRVVWSNPRWSVAGQEYVRIVYGREDTAPEHLERLRARGAKRGRWPYEAPRVRYLRRFY